MINIDIDAANGDGNSEIVVGGTRGEKNLQPQVVRVQRTQIAAGSEGLDRGKVGGEDCRVR